jgi:hypothetical protein
MVCIGHVLSIHAIWQICFRCIHNLASPQVPYQDECMAFLLLFLFYLIDSFGFHSNLMMMSEPGICLPGELFQKDSRPKVHDIFDHCRKANKCDK